MTLEELKNLAGVNSTPTKSSLCPLSGSNISITGTEKRRIEREKGIEPGTDAWFRLWFSKPYLTGEKPIK